MGKLMSIIQACRVGNVFLLPTTFLMRKVGKKRTLPTLHDYMTTPQRRSPHGTQARPKWIPTQARGNQKN